MTLFLMLCLVLAACILWRRRQNPAVLLAAFLVGSMSLGQLLKLGWLWLAGS